MSCQKCGSENVMQVQGKTSDMCYVSCGEQEHVGYVPRDMNIGAGDYLSFNVCLDCGQMQGRWPVTFKSGED